MTPATRGGGSRGATGPTGRDAGRSVAIETDAQDLASGDVTIRIASRGDSQLRRIAWASAPVLTFVVLIVLWGALVAIFRVPDYLVPAPQAVIPKLYQARQALWQNTVITLREIVIGFAITVVLSIPLGLLIALSLVARRIAYPVLVFIQLVPKIAVAPLFLVWFGFGIQSKVLLTVLLSASGGWTCSACRSRTTGWRR
jgi:NitT/TauT family transport system permease protein